MNKILKILNLIFLLIVSSCSQQETEDRLVSKVSSIDAFYQYTNTKENYFPDSLLMENEKEKISVESCSGYLKNIANFNAVETDENMHILLHYLPCVANELQTDSKDSKQSLFDGLFSNVIVNELDLTSFRSSFKRKLTDTTNTFKALGYEFNHSDKLVSVKRENWQYEFILLGRGDYNADGFEDLMVLFVDEALSSSYYSSSLLVLSKKSNEQQWVATEAYKLIK